MRTNLIILLIITFFSACTSNKTGKDAEAEILAAEQAFEKMVADSGVTSALTYFADENAVIRRANDTLVKGRDQIRNYYLSRDTKGASLTWDVEFVYVSEKGDLAYTYGKYTFSKTSDSIPEVSNGVFMTVWKRQKDGSWKYVWD